MTFSARRRIRIAWLALFAMLAGGLVPAVSQALAAARGGGIALIIAGEICAADGLGAGSAEQPRPTESPAHHDSGESAACPYCLPHGGFAGPPPSLTVRASIDSTIAPINRPRPTPRGVAHSAWANPRAPPSGD